MQLPTDRFPTEADFDNRWNIDSFNPEKDDLFYVRGAIEEDLIGSNQTIGVLLNGIWTPHNRVSNLDATNSELLNIQQSLNDKGSDGPMRLAALLNKFNEFDATPAPDIEYPGLLAVSPRIMRILRADPSITPLQAAISSLQKQEREPNRSAIGPEPK